MLNIAAYNTSIIIHHSCLGFQVDPLRPYQGSYIYAVKAIQIQKWTTFFLQRVQECLYLLEVQGTIFVMFTFH